MFSNGMSYYFLNLEKMQTVLNACIMPLDMAQVSPMNRLSFEKRKQIIHLLVEGAGVNAASRLTGAVTVLRLLDRGADAWCITTAVRG